MCIRDSQITDDILDITADEKTLGKPIGSDARSGKFTYVTAVGLEKAREQVKVLTEKAKELLSEFSDTEFLLELAETLAERSN